MSALLIDNGYTCKSVLCLKIKYSFGNGSSILTKNSLCLSDLVVAVYAVSIGATYVKLFVLIPEIVYLRSLGSVEIAVLKSFGYSSVIKLVRLDDCPAPTRIGMS